LRFVHAVHQGKFLKPTSLAASFTQHFPNIGYGWFLTKANGRELHHSNGRSPGWSAQVDHYVENDVTVIVLSNLYVSVTTPIARAVGALYFGSPVQPLPALSAQKLSSKRLAVLVGTYRFGPDYYLPNAKIRISSNGGELVGDYIEATYPQFSFIPTTNDDFVIRSFWSPARFIKGADGRAAALEIDEFRGERIE
jgi:hypothetical protein